MIPSTSVNYVADHIVRIERRHAGNVRLILDSKWRIASAVGLLYDLRADGTLTLNQVVHVDNYIAWFKSTETGSRAIAAIASLSNEAQDNGGLCNDY